MKPFRNWPIVRTFLGKNSAGKKLNEVLPFKTVRETVGSVVRGVADLSPIPNAKDASIREKAEKIYDLAGKVKLGKSQDNAESVIGQIYDLLDDGQLNGSASLSPELRKKVRLGTSLTLFGAIVYEGVAVLAGWPSFANAILILFGA